MYTVKQTRLLSGVDDGRGVLVAVEGLVGVHRLPARVLVVEVPSESIAHGERGLNMEGSLSLLRCAWSTLGLHNVTVKEDYSRTKVSLSPS